MGYKKHGARIGRTARADIRAARATGRAYIVTDPDGYPAYVVTPDGAIDRFTTRREMPARIETMRAYVEQVNSALNTLEGLG